MIGAANRGHATSISDGLWPGGAHLPRVRVYACGCGEERGIGKMGAHAQPTRIPQHSSTEY